MIKQGKEINLTDLANYIWCKNKPVFALLNANTYGFESESIVEENYPRILLVKKSANIMEESGFTSFKILDSVFEKHLGTRDKFIDLYTKLFSEMKTDLQLCMNNSDWSRLTRLIGSLAEAEHSKGSYQKQFMSTVYDDFLIRAIPDAIFKDTVYEFKTVQESKTLEKQIAIAELQADLTAYLFGYNNIYVQVLDLEKFKISESRRKADFNRVEEVLEEIFYSYYNNSLYQYADDYRCARCPYINQCK